MNEKNPVRTGAIVIADGHGASMGARAALLRLARQQSYDRS